MARGINRLTATKVSKLKTVGRYADGGGLWLQIRDGGSKQWVFRYTRQGVHRHMGLGSVVTVSLAEARERARQARQSLVEGRDPIQDKRDAIAALRIAEARTLTFAEATEQFLRAHGDGWKNPKHYAQWRSTLTTYAFPVFGDLPVGAIDVALVVKALSPIWQTTNETAHRTRQRIKRVLDFAAAQGLRTGPNPAEWDGNLEHLLAKRSKAEQQHHDALPYVDLPDFMADLRGNESLSARALEFTILTAARTSETILAEWCEIDLAARVWTVPGERTKSGRQHRVPLSDRAVAILESLPQGGAFVFAKENGKTLSNMAMLQLLRGMRPGFTVHGFRSTFSDWARDRTNYPRDVVEQSLAHAIKDKTEAAYRRGDAIEKRRRLMVEWCRFCSKPASPVTGTVTTFRDVG